MARPANGISFWDRVYSQTEEAGSCLLFTGYRDACGYGRLKTNGKTVSVHRKVWERHNGEIPPGMCVMHLCDTPNCIAPNHLSLGTHQENMADMMRKGRRVGPYGSAHPRASLVEKDVLTIRRLLSEKCTVRSIASALSVTPNVVKNIRYGRSWKHVGAE